jgi:hypothetical protein
MNRARAVTNNMVTPIPETPPAPASHHATRWEALLAEHSILQREHLDLVASFAVPYSREQAEQFVASAARLASLPPRIRQLVEDWAKSLSP